MAETEQAQTTFDRFHGLVDGMPGVTSTKPAAVKESLPLAGRVTNSVIQTFKGEEFGFAIALTIVDADGKAYNHILPNRVALAIYRQRQSLTDRSTPASRARKSRSRDAARKKRDKAGRRARYAAQNGG